MEVFLYSSWLPVICIILFVHAREKVKYAGPSPPLHPSTHLLLRRAAPLLHLQHHNPPITPPSPCLLFTKVWLSISCGLRQQALMKRPLRKGDPNQISIRMLNIHIGETSKGKCFLISAYKYHLCAFPRSWRCGSAVFSPPSLVRPRPRLRLPPRGPRWNNNDGIYKGEKEP